MRTFLSAVLFLAALSGAALAQQPVSVEDLIAAGNAQDVFVPLPGEDARALHPASGLVCRFTPGGQNRIVLFDQGMSRGEDVGCDSFGPDLTVTLYATRYPEPTSMQEQIDGAVAAIMQRFDSAEPFTPGTEFHIERDGQPLPESQTARFHVTLADRGPFYTRVSVAMVGGWVIKMRYTRRAESEASLRAADLAATMAWYAALAALQPPAGDL